jgi:ketosteroid isomerase-like protein
VSPEDLEQIRGLYDAMTRRDLEALRAFADANPDFEWQSSADEPDARVRHGKEPNIAYSRELFEAFELLETGVEEVIDLGPDAAILMVRHRVRGAASGVQVERGEAHLWTRRGGRIASLREFRTAEEARREALS